MIGEGGRGRGRTEIRQSSRIWLRLYFLTSTSDSGRFLAVEVITHRYLLRLFPILGRLDPLLVPKAQVEGGFGTCGG